MGEEVKEEQTAKTEKTKPEQKNEEKAEEKKEDKAEEEKKEAEVPKPPAPFVLYVDLHCVGCKKKIEKSIMKIRGVEGVAVDMATNQVTIKGVVEPQAVCTEIMKRTKRRAQVISPLPAVEGEPIPDVVTSQVTGLATVELNVNMHCEACAEQLKRKILKMRGVRAATTELSSGKVTVTGTMDSDKLVDYVYRRTKKLAKIVPQPEPAVEEAQPKEKKEEKVSAEANPKEQEKKKGGGEAAALDKKDDGGPQKPQVEGEKKEDAEKDGKEEKKEDGEKKQADREEDQQSSNIITDEQAMQRMVYHYQPLYVIERIPPPQLFSDENPNACSIT